MKEVKLNIPLFLSSITHLKDKSCYNNNYYQIENYGDACCLFGNNVIHEICHEDENYFELELGYFDLKGVFHEELSWTSDYGAYGLWSFVDGGIKEE